jgi:hypothetical protein
MACEYEEIESTRRLMKSLRREIKGRGACGGWKNATRRRRKRTSC